MHSIYMSANPLGFPGVWHRYTMFCCSSPLLLPPRGFEGIAVWCNFKAECQSRSLVPGSCFNQIIRRSCNGDSESEGLLDSSLQILWFSHDGPLAKRLLQNTHQIHISDSETCSCRKQMFWWRLYILIVMNWMYSDTYYYIYNWILTYDETILNPAMPQFLFWWTVANDSAWTKAQNY